MVDKETTNAQARARYNKDKEKVRAYRRARIAKIAAGEVPIPPSRLPEARRAEYERNIQTYKRYYLKRKEKENEHSI